MAKVSLLMSVHNGERHLRTAVESVIDQTLSDIEFVIIDDASTDSTPKILQEYAERDKRIRLVRNTSNLGLTRSLNRALMLAKGEYIARLDADDISLRNRLMLQSQYLDARKEIGALGTAVELIDDEGNSISREPIHTRHEAIEVCFFRHEAIEAYLLVDNCIPHSTLMAHKVLMRRIGGYDERLRYAQDYDLWWRLSRITRLAALAQPLVKLRVTGESISRIYRNEQTRSTFEISRNAVRESLCGQPLLEDAYERFWFTYHGQYERLQRGDVMRLKAVWNLMARDIVKRQVWRPLLLIMAYKLLAHEQVSEGLHLFLTLARKFAQPREFAGLLGNYLRNHIRLGSEIAQRADL